MTSPIIRQAYDIAGVVQGVGFRPAVYRLARAACLRGSVQNRAGTVRLVLEGPPTALTHFLRDLPASLPPNARISSVTPTPLAPAEAVGELHSFVIAPSNGTERPAIAIPADLALCAHCAAEIHDPADRRYGYPFTTCTNCGPRYTVVEAMPYDRERTTLARFPLCAECRAEYEDPEDRRFHAESTACPRCGPRLAIEDTQGMPLHGDALRRARAGLADGLILAVRGIGGFLLATDALNPDACRRLRERKHRPHKPFAVMAPDLDTVRRVCHVPPAAAALLTSPEAPICILDIRPDIPAHLATDLPMITPDSHTLGVMLPTSPLHDLLLTPLPGDPTPPFPLLIMTSGNRGGEPICIRNEEARERLGGIADLFLLHDREIHLRNDDSLCVVQRGHTQVWRRARGFAPAAIPLHVPVHGCVLAMGAELKNTIALAFEDRAVLSPHIGDLEAPEAVAGLCQVADALPRFLEREPDLVAIDLHPDMQCTLEGRRIAERRGIPVIEVQHHHAHAAACLAEHGRDRGLALVFDGTGLGPDGTIWGAELLDVDPSGYRRLATFAPVPLPGGDAAVRHPVRQLVARWHDAGVAPGNAWLDALSVTQAQVNTWQLQCERGINAPITHAAGRLFDAFSVLLGFAPPTVTYEGQSAIRLEAAARRYGRATALELPLSRRELDGVLHIDWQAAVAALTEDRASTDRKTEWAMAFHQAVAAAARWMVEYGLCLSRSRTVALSGGVFMNRILNDLIVPDLEKAGIEVLIHRATPPNDGGVALGQAVIAARSAGAGACANGADT